MAKRYSIQKLNEISGQLSIDTQECLNMIARDGREKMREYIQQHWYGVYSPVDYERTEDVLNSVNATISGNVVTIFYDESKISSVKTSGWGKHIGFNNEAFEIAFIEEGVSGGVDSNPRAGDDGAHAIKRVRGWLANYITKAVQAAFGASVRVR